MSTQQASTPYRAPLIAFLIANVVSICGTRVSTIAIPWFVLMSTGSPVKTGVVALAEMLPLVLSKALGGPLIDRIGPKRVSVTTDTASLVVVALIPLLHHLQALSFPVLLVLVAVAGALRGPGDAAKGTLIPDIAAAAKTPLERVTGLESTTERLAGFIAFALAGALIALVGEANALIIDALSFGLCALLIQRWIPGRHQAEKAASADETAEEQHNEGSYLEDSSRPERDSVEGSYLEDSSRPERDSVEGSYLVRLREGWRFLRGDKLLLSLIIMIAVTNLLDAAFSVVLLPVWIRDHGYGPEHFSLVLAVFSLSATLFALVASAIGERVPRKLVFTAAFLICGAPRFLVMAFDSPLWSLMVVCAVAGVGAGFINPVLGALFIERIPRPLLGRVNSLGDALAWTGVPLGGVVAGAAIAGIGMAPALLAAGAVYFIATTSPLVFGRGENWGGRQPKQSPDPQETKDRQAATASSQS